MDHRRIRHLYQRWDPAERRLALRCPFCKGLIQPRHGHLHHWMIKRGRLPPADFDLLDVEENVILVHAHCHTEYGQTREMFARCLESARQALGEGRLVDFYNGLGRFAPISSTEDLLRRT